MRFLKKNWFVETAYPDVTIALEVSEKLYSGKSQFQKIEIYQTKRFGKMLALDGVVQTTVGDEYVYHEMITHVPLCSHPEPQNILIIGGGDGGVAREALKHSSVEKITLVEIDAKVVEFSKKYLPEISGGAFDSPKLEVRLEDGAKFIKNKSETYDVIIVDSSDPIGPSTVLFSEGFNHDLAKSLKPDGIVVRQSGSSFFLQEPLQDLYRTMCKVFRHNALYTAAVPTYIGGFFTFVFATREPSKSCRPCDLDKLKLRYAKLAGKTRYYNPELHLASFQLPNYLADLLVK